MGVLADDMRLLGLPKAGQDAMVREAAWLARCVGRGEWAPLFEEDLTQLGQRLEHRRFPPGALVFAQGKSSDAVWIFRKGRVELSRRDGQNRLIVQVVHPGDVDGDIGLILQMPLPYSAHAIDDVDALRLSAEDFDWLIGTRPALARRWLSSVAARLMNAERRILQLAGRDLKTQLANLLLDEERGDSVELPQESLASLLGVRRPSLNKVLKDFERAGMVRLSYGCVDLVDRAGLVRTAGRAAHA
ncbi:MAG: Crp/Fnr family transcriptional regulator [Actinomycetota bacterium]